jgi:hypothetical protein
MEVKMTDMLDELFHRGVARYSISTGIGEYQGETRMHLSKKTKDWMVNVGMDVERMVVSYHAKDIINNVMSTLEAITEDISESHGMRTYKIGCIFDRDHEIDSYIRDILRGKHGRMFYIGSEEVFGTVATIETIKECGMFHGLDTLQYQSIEDKDHTLFLYNDYLFDVVVRLEPSALEGVKSDNSNFQYQYDLTVNPDARVISIDPELMAIIVEAAATENRDAGRLK